MRGRQHDRPPSIAGLGSKGGSGSSDTPLTFPAINIPSITIQGLQGEECGTDAEQ